jgi:flagellar protein FliO/FliZ
LPNKQVLLKVALLVIFALLGFQQPSHAEQLNNSVKDYYEDPEKFNEKEVSPKTETKKVEETEAQIGITFWDVLRMIFATIFVVVLLYFLLKFINRKNRVFNTSQLVENLGGTSLGANRSVQIIKAGNQLFVIGVGESIQLLKEIDDPEEYRHIIQEYNAKMDRLVQPSDIVTKMLERTKKFQSNKIKGQSFSSVLQKQLGELSKGRKKLFDELDKERSDKNE